MKLVERALSFTIRAHDGQYRKHDKDTPYVFHPMDVCAFPFFGIKPYLSLLKRF